MKIFIIGGTGFIGSHISRMLAAKGHRLALYHRGKPVFNHPNITEISGDRNDTGRLKHECRAFDPDTVIDTVAFTAEHGRGLQVMMRHVCGRLVLLSSCDVYRAYDAVENRHTETDATPLTESSPLRERLYPLRHLGEQPFNELLYHYDKIIVEQMTMQPGTNTTILRLPAVFGPGDPHGKLDAYIKPMLASEPVIEFSKQQAEWIFSRGYAENMAHALCLAATKKAALNQVLNLGDIHITELELARQLKALTRWKGKIVVNDTANEGPNYQQHLLISSAAAKKVLGYRPLVDAETALRQSVINIKKAVNTQK